MSKMEQIASPFINEELVEQAKKTGKILMSEEEVVSKSLPVYFSLTSEGLIFGIFSLLLGIIGLASLNPPIFIVGFGMSILLVLYFLYLRFTLSKTNVSMDVNLPVREVEAKLFAPVQVEVTTTRNLVVTFELETSDGLFPVLRPASSILDAKKEKLEEETFMFYVPRRGKERIERVVAQIGGLPGLFFGTKTIIINKEIIVLPEPQRVQLPWTLKQKIMDQFISEITVTRKGRGSDFFALKDFQFGDEIKHIAWKKSARVGKLISKEFEEPNQLKFVIVIDASLFMSGPKLEFALSSAVELCSVLRRTEHSAYVIVHGNDTLKFVKLGVSISAMRRLAVELHSVSPSGTTFNYDTLYSTLLTRRLYDSVVIFISDVEAPPSTVQKGLSLIQPYMQRTLFFACYTPGFGTLWNETEFGDSGISMDEWKYKNFQLNPLVRRSYLTRIQEFKQKVTATSTVFHLIKNYNTNILLELKATLSFLNKVGKKGGK